MKEKNNITIVRCDFCGITNNSFLTYKIPSGKNIYICKHCVDDIGSNSDACKTLIKNSDADIAIKALEQSETVTEFADRCKECGAKYNELLKEKNNILDKIRAEIEELEDVKYLIGDYAIYAKYVRLWDVIKIIDKYKAENKIEQGLDYADQDALMSAT